MNVKATKRDIEHIDALYAGRNIYFGDMHNHAATGGTSDGKRELSHWKGALEALHMDFAAILDHRQVRHMFLPEWEDGTFICGTEPGTFIGKVEEGSFSIYPHPRGRNYFAPTITGEFTETAAGCVTTVKMSLSPIIKLFEMICCIELIPLLFISLLYAVAEGNVIFLSFTVLFIALSQALVRLSFYFPAKAAEKRLRRILS